MNLMGNARAYHDDESELSSRRNIKKEHLFDILPQVKFDMMGHIHHPLPNDEGDDDRASRHMQRYPYLLKKTTSPSSSSSSSLSCPGSSPSPNLRNPAAPKSSPSSVIMSTPGLITKQFSTRYPHYMFSAFNSSIPTDSPLDFSTKRSKIGEPLDSSKEDSADESDPPCSQLRNFLSMKSPDSPPSNVSMKHEEILNLSKESYDRKVRGHRKKASSASSGSSSSSPTPMTLESYHALQMRGPGLTSACASARDLIPTFPFTNAGLPNMGISPYAIFNPNLNPATQATTGSSGATVTSIPFDSPNTHSQPSFSGLPVSTASGTSHGIPTASTSSGNGKSRVTRPFKAYPKDPLTFPTVGLYGLPSTSNGTTAINEALIQQESNQAYAEFRKQMLSQAQCGRARRIAGSSKIGTGPVSDPTASTTNPMEFEEDNADSGNVGNDSSDSQSGRNRLNKSEEQLKDDAYWERRRKNNEAAKRSRDARRAKEDEIAIRAAFLEQENLKLRFEICALKNETAKLRLMVFER